MASVTQYNAKDCTITVDNVFLTGLGEDMVSCAKDEEFFTTSVGAQGDIVVNEINNDLGTITLTLQGTSPQKALLMYYAKTRKEFPIWVTNLGIGERVGGNKARVKNFPELAQAKELDDRQFEIQVFDYTVDAL